MKLVIILFCSELYHSSVFLLHDFPLFLFQVYLTILILPWTRLRERLALPSKCNFSLLVLCSFVGVFSSILS
jgi:hypothetical protein